MNAVNSRRTAAATNGLNEPGRRNKKEEIQDAIVLPVILGLVEESYFCSNSSNKQKGRSLRCEPLEVIYASHGFQLREGDYGMLGHVLGALAESRLQKPWIRKLVNTQSDNNFSLQER